MLDTEEIKTEAAPVPVAEQAVVIPAPKAEKPVARQETRSNAIPECPYCGAVTHAPRSDGKQGYECPECESIFLGNGTGIVIEHGVIGNINEAKNLVLELKDVDEVTVSGSFRGNAQLFQIPEITLPTIAGVAIAAGKAGLTIQGTQPLFLIRN
jgi:tRNA(Ile2) C34 agmatinyltransferase TiaS